MRVAFFFNAIFFAILILNFKFNLIRDANSESINNFFFIFNFSSQILFEFNFNLDDLFYIFYLTQKIIIDKILNVDNYSKKYDKVEARCLKLIL